MGSEGFKVGDLVEITNWGENDGSDLEPSEDDKRYNGMTGPITRILDEGKTIFVDIGEPGIFFNDLICYPNELNKLEG